MAQQLQDCKLLLLPTSLEGTIIVGNFFDRETNFEVDHSKILWVLDAILCGDVYIVDFCFHSTM